jgi:exodeoxyribonuclease III
MFRVVTINTNGLRAAARKGLFAWLGVINPDVVCIQETKAQEHQLEEAAYHLPGFTRYFHDAQKRGYSGTAIFTKHQPKKVITGLGWAVADDEGRYVQVDFEGLSVASIYLPSGSSGEIRQAVKYAFLDQFEQHLMRLRSHKNDAIICGDFNIAHKKIDIKNWRGNQKNSGFLPEERAWMDKLWVKWAMLTLSVRKTKKSISIRGGLIVGRPTLITWVGAWTIKWLAPPSSRLSGLLKYIKTRNFPITHLISWIMI